MFINTQVQHASLTSKYSMQIKGRGGKGKAYCPRRPRGRVGACRQRAINAFKCYLLTHIRIV